MLGIIKVMKNYLLKRNVFIYINKLLPYVRIGFLTSSMSSVEEKNTNTREDAQG